MSSRLVEPFRHHETVPIVDAATALELSLFVAIESYLIAGLVGVAVAFLLSRLAAVAYPSPWTWSVDVAPASRLAKTLRDRAGAALRPDAASSAKGQSRPRRTAQTGQYGLQVSNSGRGSRRAGVRG